jgi:hypothetical protein
VKVQRYAFSRRGRLRERPHEPGEVFWLHNAEDGLTNKIRRRTPQDRVNVGAHTVNHEIDVACTDDDSEVFGQRRADASGWPAFHHCDDKNVSARKFLADRPQPGVTRDHRSIAQTELPDLLEPIQPTCDEQLKSAGWRVRGE